MVLPILNMKGKKSVYTVDTALWNFLGLPWFFPFSSGTDGMKDNRKDCVIEADTAKLIFTLQAFKFAVQLILFCKEGENTGLSRSSLCAVFVCNILQG